MIGGLVKDGRVTLILIPNAFCLVFSRRHDAHLLITDNSIGTGRTNCPSGTLGSLRTRRTLICTAAPCCAGCAWPPRTSGSAWPPRTSGSPKAPANLAPAILMLAKDICICIYYNCISCIGRNVQVDFSRPASRRTCIAHVALPSLPSYSAIPPASATCGNSLTK